MNTNRRVLVTGGAAGIGWAICRALAARGYRIALADIDAAAARAGVKELGDGHVALSVDLTDRASAAALPQLAAEALGRLDVIVNNAGMTDTSGKSLTGLPVSSFDRLIALNLSAVEAICSAAPRVLRPGSAIVNLASGAAWRPLALRGPYSATKAGIVALTEALAREYASRGIAVSAIAPGYTLTPLVQSLADEGLVDLEKVAAGIPLGRIALPEDIAAAVVFSASQEGRVLSGETLGVDGLGLFGPAPQGTAPAAGTAGSGSLAILSAPDGLLPEGAGGMAALQDPAGIAAAGPLNALIDFTALSPDTPAPQVLSHIREVAIRAAQAERRQDFSLLFVSGPGKSAESRAAVAAGGMLAKTLALEWAPSGIRVNALEWHGTELPDLLAVCRFLVGEGAAMITGQVVRAGLAKTWDGAA